MKRYTNTVRMIHGMPTDLITEAVDGEIVYFEEVQALLKTLWPHFDRRFDHAKDCAPIDTGLPCTCGADSLRDQLKAIIEAQP